MRISEEELKLIIAALRHSSMTIGKVAEAAPTFAERNKWAAFANACGLLSNRLENDHKTAPALILPH